MIFLDNKYKAFEKEIEKATRIVFPCLKEKIKDEGFYTFGIFFANGFEYLELSANTNLGNIEETQKHLEWYKKEYKKESPNDFDKTLKELKWDFGSWKYYNNDFIKPYNQEFAQAESIMQNMYEDLDKINKKKLSKWKEQDYYEEWSIFHNEILESTIKAIKKLDKTGLFGTGKERENITLWISTFDINYELCEYINSEKNYTKLITELHEIGWAEDIEI